MFHILEDFPDDTIALEAKGKIIREDYKKTIWPLIAQKMVRHDKFKIYFVIGDELDQVTVGAMFEDFSTGIKNRNNVESIAIVTNLGWVKSISRLFQLFTKAPVKLFKPAEAEEAEYWLENTNREKAA